MFGVKLGSSNFLKFSLDTADTGGTLLIGAWCARNGVWIMSLPNWPGADKCYSRAYKLLDYWAKTDVQPFYYRGKMRSPGPSQRMVDLISALNKGDEEYIKGTLLQNLKDCV